MAAARVLTRTLDLPAGEVLTRLRGRLSGGWRLPAPPGGLVGVVRDTRVVARRPMLGRRFPPMLDVQVAAAGRGAQLTGRVRRHAMVVPMLCMLVLFDAMLALVALLADTSGAGPLVFVVPVAFLLAVIPTARVLLPVAAADVAALQRWLDETLSADATAGTGP